MRKNRLISIICIILFLCLKSNSFANILINEVYPFPDPNSTEPNEWVELININFPSASPDLSNWTIWDTTTSPSLLFTFTDNQLFYNQYFTIETNNKLNNSGDGVILKDSSGNVVDQFSYSSSQSGMSWSRINIFDNLFSLTKPSKNTTNIFPPTATPTQIPTPAPIFSPSPPAPNQNLQNPFLSEIMACPESGNEWIEIYNPNSSIFYLQNWSLYDSQGKLVNFQTEFINPSSFFTVEINQKLNNTTDQVILKNANQDIISMYSYSNCLKGFSWIWQNDNWIRTDIITRNEPNPVLVANENDASSIDIELTPEPTQIINNEDNDLSTSLSKKTPILQNKSPTYLLKSPNTKTTTKIEQQNAKFISSPMFYRNVFFKNNPKKPSFIISAIMGGLLYLIVGIIIIRDISSNDFKQDY